MKKYKLKKWYPSLKGWEKGDIAYPVAGTSKPTNIVCYTSKNIVAVSVAKHEVENNSEYWEEIIEKGYEILSFRLHKWATSHLCEDGLYHVVRGSQIGETEQEMLDGDYHIHSVKRLSDGEVFTVGDKVKAWDGLRKIHKIIITYHGVGFVMDFQKTLSNIVQEYNSYTLKNINPHTVLFTTQDGVDIFEGDKIWGINECTWIPFYQSANERKIKEKWKYGKFSTKEATEEYILMNKPCLSINDILKDYLFSSSLDDLKELVKSKL